MDETLRELMIGEWRAELSGVDLLLLEPVDDRDRITILLKPDGTASWNVPPQGPARARSKPEPPFPETWSLSEDRVLTILIPIAPKPEYEIPDWIQDAIRYDVLAVNDISLALSDRRHDGESVIVLRRINDEEFQQEQVRRYREVLGAAQEIIRRSRMDRP